MLPSHQAIGGSSSDFSAACQCDSMKQRDLGQVDVASSKFTQVICKTIAVPYLWLFINQILINMQEMEWELQSVSNPSVRTYN